MAGESNGFFPVGYPKLRWLIRFKLLGCTDPIVHVVSPTNPENPMVYHLMFPFMFIIVYTIHWKKSVVYARPQFPTPYHIVVIFVLVISHEINLKGLVSSNSSICLLVKSPIGIIYKPSPSTPKTTAVPSSSQYCAPWQIGAARTNPGTGNPDFGPQRPAKVSKTPKIFSHCTCHE